MTTTNPEPCCDQHGVGDHDSTEHDEHCGNDCNGVRYADGQIADDPNPEECVHCECCCECLGCVYGPRVGMPLTEEQRAPIAEVADQQAKDWR